MTRLNLYNPYLGDKYTGEWLNNKRSGSGIYTWGEASKFSGDTYIGEFKDNNMHGYGEYKKKDGSYYRGSYENNQKSGIGILFSAKSSEKYEGRFLNDEMDGSGFYRFANGRKEITFWEMGKNIREIITLD